MSIFVKTRTPTQCRSQSQKLFKRDRSINLMIEKFKKTYGGERF
jgi:hypothetical protein